MLTAGFRTFVTSVVVALTVAGATLVGAGNNAASAAQVGTTARVGTVINATMETTVLALTNIRRAAAGCAPLRFNRELRTAARRHSARMANAGQMSHQLPGEPSLGRRITLAGYTQWRLVAENVAVGFDSARWVMRAWWLSASHRRNIKNCSLREIGIGVVVKNGQLWWTQNFGRR